MGPKGYMYMTLEKAFKNRYSFLVLTCDYLWTERARERKREREGERDTEK